MLLLTAGQLARIPVRYCPGSSPTRSSKFVDPRLEAFAVPAQQPGQQADGLADRHMREQTRLLGPDAGSHRKWRDQRNTGRLCLIRMRDAAGEGPRQFLE